MATRWVKERRYDDGWRKIVRKVFPWEKAIKGGKLPTDFLSRSVFLWGVIQCGSRLIWCRRCNFFPLVSSSAIKHLHNLGGFSVSSPSSLSALANPYRHITASDIFCLRVAKQHFFVPCPKNKKKKLLAFGRLCIVANDQRTKSKDKETYFTLRPI